MGILDALPVESPESTEPPPEKAAAEPAPADLAPAGPAALEPGRRARRIWDHVRTVLIAIVLAMCIRTGFAQAYVVEGPSMEPTLDDGQRVLVVKYPFGLTLPAAEEALVTWSEPEAGDVVIFGSPLDGTDLVKRVVGVPGDIIEIRDDAVFRNGQPLATGRVGDCRTPTGIACEWREERLGEVAWQTRFDADALPETHPPQMVPPGHVFVLGDHRDRSNDSRFFGTVPTTRLRGRVAFLD